MQRLLLLLTLVIFLLGCNPQKSPQITDCVPAPAQPFRKTAVISLDSTSTAFFKKQLIRFYVEMKIEKRQGRTFAVVRNMEGVSVFTLNEEMIAKPAHHHAPMQEKDRFYRNVQGRYGYYQHATKNMYVIKDILDSPLHFTDTFAVDNPVLGDSLYLQNEMQGVFFNQHEKVQILWNYGINKQKNINYLDDNIFLYAKDNRHIRLGNYPYQYNRSYRENRKSYYGMDTSDIVYYAPAYSDSVYKMTLQGQYLGAASIAPCRSFDAYEEEDLTDLAYKRRYTEGSEQNLALEIINNRLIAILRHKSSLQKKAQPGYIITVYDMNLKKMYHHEITQRVLPILLHDLNKIFLLDETFKKMYVFHID
jgi:hypothetical protein